MRKILLKLVLSLFISLPIPAFSCGLATPLCIAYGEAMIAWLSGGLVVASGTLRVLVVKKLILSKREMLRFSALVCPCSSYREFG